VTWLLARQRCQACGHEQMSVVQVYVLDGAQCGVCRRMECELVIAVPLEQKFVCAWQWPYGHVLVNHLNTHLMTRGDA
jgi:hypothetical protein